MRIEPERKLFVGIRIDNKMRDQLVNCAPRDKQYIDGSDPNYLMQVRAVEDSYIGKSVDAGAPAISMEDLKRNILSILNRIAPGRHREDAIKVFALDEGEPPPLPEKEPAGERDYY
jgi:hypothetical protein